MKTLEDDRDSAQRRAAKVEQQQERLVRHFRKGNNDRFSWRQVAREIARAEGEICQIRVAVEETGRRKTSQQAAAKNLADLAAYCARVSANLGVLRFDDLRTALKAHGEQIVASGRG